MNRFTDPFWARCFVTYSRIEDVSAAGSNNRMAASRWSMSTVSFLI